MTRGIIRPWRWIGAKMFAAGARMQSVAMRRQLAVILGVGIAWADENSEIMDRAVRGEHMTITICVHAEVE